MGENNEARKNIIKSGGNAAISVVDSVIATLIPLSPLQVISSISNSYSTIKQELFNEKLLAFLQRDDSITENEREIFVKLLEDDKDEFFKRIFIVLDRLDSVEKAKILGNLFTALIRGHITMEVFLELTPILENSYIKDIRIFFSKYADKPVKVSRHPPWREADLPFRKLSSLGLLNHDSTRLGAMPVDHFELTPLGAALALYGK